MCAASCRIEFLTHDISVHVPHHVSSKIPWYNLRLAHNSLKKNWGEVSCSSCSFCSLSGLFGFAASVSDVGTF